MSDLGTWLVAEGVQAVITQDGFVPSSPDRLVVLTGTGGAGQQLEGAFDLTSVQVRSRGITDSGADCEALAAQVDNVLLGAATPITVGPRRVIAIQRVGGPPSFLSRDEARRTTYVCNYLLTADSETPVP